MKNIEIIGIASGWGAQVRESEYGPKVIQESGLHTTIAAKYDKIAQPNFSSANTNIEVGMNTKPVLMEVFEKAATHIDECLRDGNFPIVIGGDHSNAIATWGTLINHYDVREDFGLIWLDAHMDAHTHQTSPSKAFHGMPLACLLGHGEKEFTNFKGPLPKLDPKHLVLIGIRSYEKAERDLLESLGVRVMYMAEVKSRGFEECLKEAVSIASAGKKFGVSLDLDFFDPEFAPGTPSLEPDGEDPKNVLPHLADLKSHDKFCAFELVEFNPATDQNGITLKLAQDVIKQIV
jgi:arginase